MSTPVPRRYDLVVVGAGSGGYVAGIRAAQLGLTVIRRALGAGPRSRQRIAAD